MWITFTNYIYLFQQEIEIYHENVKASQDNQGGGMSQPGPSKKTKHFYKPTVERFPDKDDPTKSNFYLIAGDVFLVSGEVKKLSQDDIKELPITISWKGPLFSFETDEAKCFELLTKIIYDMNLMQDPRFVSFPLGRFHVFV